MTLDFRPLRSNDYDALAEMFTDANIADGRLAIQVGEEIRENFESLPVELEAHTFSAWDGERLAGAVYAYHIRSEERQECCYVFGSVHPAYRGRGIGRHLLREGLKTADQLLRDSNSKVSKVIRIDTSRTNIAAMHLFEREGLRPVRYFEDLHRPLSSVIEIPHSTGFRVVPWVLDRNEEVRAVRNIAFQDHWGSIPLSEELWTARTTGFGSRPDLSFLAVSPDDQIVGYLLSHRYESDDSLLGAKYGWVDNLATLAEWRGRGVATQLLATALTGFRTAGFEFAALEVDSDNETGAHRLYESLGFRLWRATVMYEREVDTGS